MKKDKAPYRSYPIRHSLISWMVDLDIKGVRRIADKLQNWILPNPKNQGEILLHTIHGFDLLINPSEDQGVELSLYKTGSYERGILNFIEKNYKAKGTFIDVGANIGLISIFVGMKFPNSMIHAIEAHPETMEIFMQNAELNSVANIVFHDCAVGNSTGEIELYENIDINRGAASAVVKTENSKVFNVRLERIDDLSVGNPEIIKIDVEGYELEVIKGAKETISTHHPILIVEVSENRENEHTSSQALIDYIKTLGDYSIYKLKGGKERRSKLVQIVNEKDIPQHDNIICLPNPQ